MMMNLSPEMIPLLFWAGCAPLFLLALGLEFFLRKERSLWKKLLSGPLRAGALFCMGALLADRIDSEWTEKKQMPPLLLLEDVSASMKQGGLWSEEEKKKLLEALLREQRRPARHAATAFSSSFSSSGAHFPLLHFRFSDRLYEGEDLGTAGKRNFPGEKGNAAAPSPDAEYATALGDALLEIAQLYPSSNILLLSDGISNAGISPFYASDLLRCSGNAVHPLLGSGGSGEKGERRRALNLSVRTQERADDVDADGRLYFIDPRLENLDSPSALQQDPDGDDNLSEVTTLSIRIDGKLLHEESLTLSLTAGSAPLTRRIPDPEDLEPGWHEYEVSLSPLKGERRLSDNTAKGVLQSHSGTGVLILWDRNSPELNALREVFRRRYPSAFFSYASSFAKESPARKTELVRNAVLLLLGPGCPPDLFGAHALKLLRGKLEKDEMTLIFLHPQTVGSWLGEPGFGELLPVTGKGSAQSFKSPLSAEFSPSGEEGTPRLRLPFHNLWHFPLKPSGGAAVLRSARAGGMEPGSRKTPQTEETFPLLISSGKCVIAAFTGSWRWKQHPERAVQQIHSAYWEDLLDRTDRFGKEALHLVLEPEKRDSVLQNLCSAVLSYSPGKGETSSLLSAELELLGETGSPENARSLQKFLPQKDGTYRTRFRVVTPGIHWFRAAADVLVEKDGRSVRKRLFSGKVPFIVKDERLETTRATDGERVLREIARRSGGETLSLRSLEEKGLPFPIKEHSMYRRNPLPSGDREKETLLFLSALLLLTLEWLVRRQEDMKENA